MGNEIKEIYLSNLEWTKTHDNMGGVMGNTVFKDNMSYEEYQKLFKTTYFVLCDKDYITNLQKENKEWSMIFDTFSKRPYAHKYLEEKKKELGNKKIIGLDSEMIYKDYYDYKSRCEKAIQREMELSYLCDTPPDEELLNILQGEDKK